MGTKLLRRFGYGLLTAHFSVIVAIWLGTSFDLLRAGDAVSLIAIGQLCGLLAAGCALLQFMLMGRVAWVEQAFGLENLAKLHRLNGYATISFIIVHPILLTFGYALTSHTDPLAQFLSFLTEFQDVWLALIAAVLFIIVVAASIYIVRRRLNYETWHLVHYTVYAAILLAFWHQVHVGSSFVARPGLTFYWSALYIFVGLNVLFWRFTLPSLNLMRFRFTVDEVKAETADTVSVYISGRHLERFKARPGQFIIIRILRPAYWLEEHPFSLSALPANGRLRITVKNVGDYTKKLQALAAGMPVLISGPYGRFTPSPTSTKKRLYIAGGVGITPLRTMLEAQKPAINSVLLYGNKTVAETIFAAELESLTKTRHLRIHHVYSEEPSFKGETGYIDIERITRLVPDFRKREVYLCGPPQMMAGLTKSLTLAGLPPSQLHSERFALHPIS